MSKETVLTGLNARAPGYVPEWRPSSPDAGTALAHIWAELFSGTLERFERLPGNCRRALLDMMGSEAKPALPARGVLAFQAGGERVRVPAGTGTASPGNPDAVLETERDLDVSPALIDAVFYASPSRGAVTRYPGRENIALFGAEAPEPHIWTFRHPYAFRVSERSSLRLRVEPESAGALLCDHTAVWEAGGEDGWEVFPARPGGRGILLNLPPGQGAERQTLRVTLPGGAASNAAISSVTALPGGNALFPDAVYAGDTQLSGDRAYPFDKRFIPGLCFYVACGDAFDKPGADIELSFHLSFEDFPIEGYPEVQIRLKKLMKAAELEP
ncbi:MAG: hypothetical protein LBR76_08090, partial [Oscillospiraceae bacterium]|nr:hypothetical protein [Oscillospiraceae bacterium]